MNKTKPLVLLGSPSNGGIKMLKKQENIYYVTDLFL